MEESGTTLSRNQDNCLDYIEIHVPTGLFDVSKCEKSLTKHWYVMRDLKRVNAREHAYELLSQRGIENYTPMQTRVFTRGGRKTSLCVPVISDLLFVHESRDVLDPIVEEIPTLQYRYVRGAYRKPMEVEAVSMEQFIRASRVATSITYYTPEQVTPAMHGKRVRVIGGAMHGVEGELIATRGTRARRLLLSLTSLISAVVHVLDYDYIEIIE